MGRLGQIIMPYSSGGVTAFNRFKFEVSSAFNAGTRFQVTELYVSESSNGSNILTGSTASDSNHFTGMEASKAIDGSTTTYWSNTAGTYPASATYALGSAKTAKVLGFSVGSGASNGGFNAFTLSGSNDGSSWTTLATIPADTFVAAYGVDTTYYWPAKSDVEMWRLLITAAQSSTTQVNITEFELRDGGGTNLLTGGLPTASSCNSASTIPSKAFDNSTGQWTNNTQYNALDGAKAVWVGYIPTAAITPATLYLKTNNTVQGPGAFKLQKSTDGGATWTDESTQTGQTWSAPNYDRSYNL